MHKPSSLLQEFPPKFSVPSHEEFYFTISFHFSLSIRVFSFFLWDASPSLLLISLFIFVADLCARISEALSALAQSANRSHSEFGLKTPLEPLYGAAPLKYVHEGDLLTLRLLLDNITLTGFTSMTVQEVRTYQHDCTGDKDLPAWLYRR